MYAAIKLISYVCIPLLLVGTAAGAHTPRMSSH